MRQFSEQQWLQVLPHVRHCADPECPAVGILHTHPWLLQRTEQRELAPRLPLGDKVVES